MPDVGVAWVSLAISAKGLGRNLEKELGSAGGAAGDAFSTEFDKASSKGRGFEAVSTKALLFAGAVGAGFFGLAKSASDLEESINAVEVRFGQFGDGAVDHIKRVGEAASTDFGLTQAQFNEAAVAFSGFAENIGTSGADIAQVTTDLIGRATDFASVFNLDVNESISLFQSTLAGQSEPIRRFGFDMSEAAVTAHALETGIAASAAEMTASDKVLARYSLLMQETSFAAGDFENTSEGLANQLRIMKATVGEFAADFGKPIVGFAADLVGAVGGGLTGLQEWNEETGGMLATGLSAGLGIAAAGAAAAGIYGKVKSAAAAFKGLSTGVKLATGIVGGLALAVTGGFIAYGLLTRHSREVKARTAEVAAAMGQATEEAWEYALATANAAENVDGIAVAQRALGLAVTSTSEEVTDAFATLGVQAIDAGKHLLAIGEDPLDAMRSLGREAGLSSGDTEILAQVIAQLASRSNDFATEDLAASIFAVGEASGMTRDEAKALAEELQPMADAMEEVFDAASPEELAKVAAEFLNGAVSASEYGEELVVAAEAQAEASRSGEDAFLVYEALMDIVADLAPAERDAALDALGLAGAMGDTADAAGDAESELVKGVQVMGDMADAADDAAAKVNAFDAALDDLIGVGLNLRDAHRRMKDGFEDIAEAALDADGNVVDFNSVLRGTTREGRDAQAMIDDSVENILEWGRAQIDAGESIEWASAAMNGQAEVLIGEVARAFGITEAEARDYIRTLGLTPENITTAVELADLDTRKRELQTWIDSFDGVPDSIATAVKAATDEQSLVAAERRLRIWAASLRLTVIAGVTTNRGATLRQQAVAYGGYFEGNNLTPVWIGDAPWDEAVLTVGNPDNLRKQLMDERIGGPILEALPKVSVSGGDGGRRHRREGDVILQSYEQNPTPAGVATALRMARAGA